MSLNTAATGLGGVKQTTDNAQNTVSKTTKPVTKPVKQTTDTTQNTVNQTTKPVEKTISDTASNANIPGSFPAEEPPTNQKNNVTVPPVSELWTTFLAWLKGLIPRGVDIFEAAVRRFVNWLIPPERQAKMYKAAMEHPIAATFLAAQLICCGIPLVLFIAGTLLFAAVAAIVWVLLSILILGPIMLVASLMGVSLWGWGWFLFGLVRWIDRLLLGGIMERFWLAQIQSQKEEEEEEKEQKEEGDGGDEKKGNEEKQG
ncbi:hypothetical protein BDW59DRAFT_166755 [Aspergillus cavernicola]|uniref:Uncharacterized protein n=1 Tax=Aspergillus cavernicola TaxID=176166 RepID=A0ABR4HLI7_9EURO